MESSASQPESKEPERPPTSDRHLWQIQWVRDLLVGLGLLGLLLLGSRLSLVTSPLLLAILLAYLFEPLVVRLTRVRWVSRRLATAGILVAFVLGVGIPAVIGLGFGVLQGVDFAGGIAARAGAVIASVGDPQDDELRAAIQGEAWLGIRDYLVELDAEPDPDAEEEPLSILGIDRSTVRRGAGYVMNWVRDNAEQVAQRALATGRGAMAVAVSTVGSAGRFAFGAFLTAFFFFFVSFRWPDVLDFGRGLFPEENRERAAAIVKQMDRAVNGFVRGRLTIGLLLAVFYTIGFWLIGVPAPLIFGPSVALITLIPYAALLAVPVVMVFLWLEGNAGVRGGIWWILLAPLVLYQVGQALDDYVFTPLIQGKSTNLDTPTILFASIAGGILLGVFGLLVAIPLAACTKILLTEVFWPRFRAWTRGQNKDFLPID